MSDNKAPNLAGGKASGEASRKPYWAEADTADKLERLRDEVSRLCIVVTEHAELIAKLVGHRHGTDGALLVTLNEALQRPLGVFAHDGRMSHSIRTEQERR